MTPHQKKVLDDVPPMYRVHYEKAYAGTSRKASITAFCLHCVGNVRADITNCTSYGCPLYPQRPYQRAENTGDIAPETTQTESEVVGSQTSEINEAQAKLRAA